MDQEPSDIREAIEGTRTELADTIEALGHKADFKSRVTENVKEGSENLSAKARGAAEHVQNAVPTRSHPRPPRLL